ncbi:type II toxin-antitoxin system RelE/ParE family toxin [Ruminococcus sp.]|uniref:type II toxin-antitoxin system RelE/ParE family toxin n=1 Tax=Ruminococcus sp. TaxID=41978 RepID=UPI00345C8AA0
MKPGNNRVFYFFMEEDTFVLLHHFRKKSQKTPRREIEKAKVERKDYPERREEN